MCWQDNKLGGVTWWPDTVARHGTLQIPCSNQKPTTDYQIVYICGQFLSKKIKIYKIIIIIFWNACYPLHLCFHNKILFKFKNPGIFS